MANNSDQDKALWDKHADLSSRLEQMLRDGKQYTGEFHLVRDELLDLEKQYPFLASEKQKQDPLA